MPISKKKIVLYAKKNMRISSILSRAVFDKHAIGNSAILFRNSIPMDIRGSINLGKFKECLKDWFSFQHYRMVKQ